MLDRSTVDPAASMGEDPASSMVEDPAASLVDAAVIPIEERQKLDNKEKQLRLVGYEEGKKGYRLLDTITDRIYISNDVNFIEGDLHTNQMTEGVNETESHHKRKSMPIE